MIENGPEKWLKLRITAPLEMADAIGNFLEETGASGVFSESLLPPGGNELPEPAETEDVFAFFPVDVRMDKRVANVRKYLKSLEDIFPGCAAPALETEVVVDPDWGEQWKKYFKPIRACNNIVVKPTWERYTPASRDIVVEIDPGMAFGTGQHASTRMCMEAIEEILLKDRSVSGWKVLDVGCGTGILGITAAKLGAQDVVCVDNDPKATQIAEENARLNDVDLRLLNVDAAQIRDQRNLIIANLTAKLLVKLHDHFVKLLLPEGYMILSGIIEQDMQTIEEHYCALPLELHRVLREKEWVCYILKRKPSDAA